MSEEVHARAPQLDAMSGQELLEVINEEDRNAVAAVKPQIPSIARAVDQIVDRLRAGGRLHYFGAGTSGRLAVLDAAECPATFGIPVELVQAHDAGDGEAEDDAEKGRDEAKRAGLTSRDAVVGVSAGGRATTPTARPKVRSTSTCRGCARVCTPRASPLRRSSSAPSTRR